MMLIFDTNQEVYLYIYIGCNITAIKVVITAIKGSNITAIKGSNITAIKVVILQIVIKN